MRTIPRLNLCCIVPEGYRQQFRKLRRSKGQTCVEFVRELTSQFNHWVAASAVETMDDMRELILREQLKDSP